MCLNYTTKIYKKNRNGKNGCVKNRKNGMKNERGDLCEII